jgi:hypothetical protein
MLSLKANKGSQVVPICPQLSFVLVVASQPVYQFISQTEKPAVSQVFVSFQAPQLIAQGSPDAMALCTTLIG